MNERRTLLVHNEAANLVISSPCSGNEQNEKTGSAIIQLTVSTYIELWDVFNEAYTSVYINIQSLDGPHSEGTTLWGGVISISRRHKDPLPPPEADVECIQWCWHWFWVKYHPFALPCVVAQQTYTKRQTWIIVPVILSRLLLICFWRLFKLSFLLFEWTWQRPACLLRRPVMRIVRFQFQWRH